MHVKLQHPRLADLSHGDWHSSANLTKPLPDLQRAWVITQDLPSFPELTFRLFLPPPPRGLLNFIKVCTVLATHLYVLLSILQTCTTLAKSLKLTTAADFLPIMNIILHQHAVQVISTCVKSPWENSWSCLWPCNIKPSMVQTYRRLGKACSSFMATDWKIVAVRLRTGSVSAERVRQEEVGGVICRVLNEWVWSKSWDCLSRPEVDMGAVLVSENRQQ